MTNMKCSCGSNKFFNRVKEGVVVAICSDCGNEWEDNPAPPEPKPKE